MQKLVVNGGNRLNGEIRIQGAKNSILPIMSAAVLVHGETMLENCPDLSDVYAAGRILNYIGIKVNVPCRGNLIINNSGMIRSNISEELMRQMRSSIIFLGAILGENGECELFFPGGCQLGPRPLDIHLSSLKQMGVNISEEHGSIKCRACSGGLKGCRIILQFPSVGATENIILAAVKAKGETEIKNAAREPEIFDLINFLKKAGAKIECSEDSTIRINGVSELHGCEHRIIPDRIAAATYMAAAAMTGGVLRLTGTNGIDVSSFTSFFEQMGCSVYIYNDSVYIKASKKLRTIKSFKTMPYPGFPTDMQAVFMAVMSIADGTSVFEENIFENRYKHVDALNRMGTEIKVYGKIAVVEGVSQLWGANVEATDLRGGAAMILASLAASGKSEISGILHVDRGYEKIDEILLSAGADIHRR